MGYQCISYWYVGGWNQHGWPLNHFSARERRFCYNVPVEAWNSCKGSYIEQKHHMNLVKTNCKRNSPKSGMYVGVILLMKTSKFRHHHYQYHHFICNIYSHRCIKLLHNKLEILYVNWLYCWVFHQQHELRMAMDASPSLGFTSGTSQSAEIHC